MKEHASPLNPKQTTGRSDDQERLAVARSLLVTLARLVYYESLSEEKKSQVQFEQPGFDFNEQLEEWIGNEYWLGALSSLQSRLNCKI